MVLFVRILLITVINLYSVRFVLNGLGDETYGIFNAVMGVIMTCSCVFPILAVSVQRFYSYAMGKGETQQLKEIFSASINIIMVSLTVIVLLFETIGLYFVRHKLQIPIENVENAIVLFHFAMLTFAFSYLQIPYTAAVFAHEDMGYYAIVSSVDCLLKLIVALSINYIANFKLAFYGGGLTLVSLFILSAYIYIGRRHYTECRYIRVSQRGIYKQLLSFSGWTMYGAFAGIGIIQGNTILLNIFFGPLANAAFGVANNIYNAFVSLTNSMAIPFRPRMIKSYAAGDTKYLSSLFYANNKFILYLLIATAIPVILEMPIIIRLWLNKSSADTVLYSRLFIIYSILLAMHNPITTIMQASNNIKYYHLTVESITILCLPITWLMFKYGFPSYCSFASMIALVALAHIARLLCLHHYNKNFSYISYMQNILLPGCIVVCLTAFGEYYIHTQMHTGITRLITVFTTSPLLTFTITYIIGLSHSERTYLKDFATKIVKR